MCGITGMIYRDLQRPVAPETLQRMCDVLAHRGPDDDGQLIDGHVGLGMRRLSVMDMDNGRQPIANEDGRIWVVFNGEMYNYLDVRKHLERQGHVFATQTDTETIVHAYEAYGESCAEVFNGMFAFAVWDAHQQRLILARDRLGIKPLYYYEDGERLIFGSELKAILAHPEVPRQLDFEALDSFLTCEYIPAPLSIFQGIRKLSPGHVFVWDAKGSRLQPYWRLERRPLDVPEAELGEALYDLLQDAVRLRLMSDVPLGAFLSGGVDSSAIVALMSDLVDQPVKTFSIGFDDPSYNELTYARAVANTFGSEHRDLNVQPDVVSLVDELVTYLDEPLADVSVFPTYLLSQLARQDVTVALSGDGGDELFAGYDWYVANRVAGSYQVLPRQVRVRWLPRLLDCMPPSARKKGLINRCKRFVEGAALPERWQHFRWNLFLTEADKQCLYGDAWPHQPDRAVERLASQLDVDPRADALWRQQHADIRTFLVDDILVKVDRMSMAHGLEVRTPFLDHRLVAFAAGLPVHLRLRGLQTKVLLKRSMASKLPSAVLKRRKEGFSIPMKNWLGHELRPMLREVLSPSRLAQYGLFNPSYVSHLIAEHVSGVANHAHRLWPLMMFEIWRERYLDAPPAR